MAKMIQTRTQQEHRSVGEGDGAYKKLRKAPSALTESLRWRREAEEEASQPATLTN